MKASKGSPGPRTLPTLPTPTTAPPPDPASPPRPAVVTPMLAPAVEPDDLGAECGNGAEEPDEAAAFAAEAEEAALQADQRLEEMDAMEPPGEDDEDGAEEDATEKGDDNEEVAGAEGVEE